MNKRSTNRTLSATAAATLLMASLALVGCDRRDDTTATTNTTDSTMAQGEQRARELQADASRGIDQAANNAREIGRDVRDASKEASDKTSSKVSDALITTEVNAELAKDPSLSAVKINVDTDAARVVLRGTAPSESARERATRLASSVKGVTSVDNQLSIEPRKM